MVLKFSLGNQTESSVQLMPREAQMRTYEPSSAIFSKAHVAVNGLGAFFGGYDVIHANQACGLGQNGNGLGRLLVLVDGDGVVCAGLALQNKRRAHDLAIEGDDQKFLSVCRDLEFPTVGRHNRRHADARGEVGKVPHEALLLFVDDVVNNEAVAWLVALDVDELLVPLLVFLDAFLGLGRRTPSGYGDAVMNGRVQELELLVTLNLGGDGGHGHVVGLGALGAGHVDHVEIADAGPCAASAGRRAVNGNQVVRVDGRRERAAGPMHDQGFLAFLSSDVPQRLGLQEARAECAKRDVLVVFGRQVVVHDAVRHGICARGKRCPHRRRDGGVGTQHAKILAAGALLHQLLQVGHLALIDQDARKTRIHAVDAQKQHLVCQAFRSKHISLPFLPRCFVHLLHTIQHRLHTFVR